MPKRSNEFQKLIYLVKKHVSSGATVTESKLLQDRITSMNREVDICIESEVGDSKVMICIECIGRKRPADVLWVEGMRCKHEQLPTNKLVLVSKSGFSKKALEVARIYGLETFMFKEFNTESTERMFGDSGSLWAKTFTLHPDKVIFSVMPEKGLPEENVLVHTTTLIYSLDGREISDAKQIVEDLLTSSFVIKKLRMEGGIAHRGFYIKLEQPKNKAGKPLCLQKLEPKVLRPIKFIQISGRCHFDVSEFPLVQGTVGRVKVAWGEGKFLDKKAMLVATENLSGEKKLTISTKHIDIVESIPPKD